MIYQFTFNFLNVSFSQVLFYFCYLFLFGMYNFLWRTFNSCGLKKLGYFPFDDNDNNKHNENDGDDVVDLQKISKLQAQFNAVTFNRFQYLRTIYLSLDTIFLSAQLFLDYNCVWIHMNFTAFRWTIRRTGARSRYQHKFEYN